MGAPRRSQQSVTLADIREQLPEEMDDDTRATLESLFKGPLSRSELGKGNRKSLANRVTAQMALKSFVETGYLSKDVFPQSKHELMCPELWDALNNTTQVMDTETAQHFLTSVNTYTKAVTDPWMKELRDKPRSPTSPTRKRRPRDNLQSRPINPTPDRRSRERLQSQAPNLDVTTNTIPQIPETFSAKAQNTWLKLLTEGPLSTNVLTDKDARVDISKKLDKVARMFEKHIKSGNHPSTFQLETSHPLLNNLHPALSQMYTGEGTITKEQIATAESFLQQVKTFVNDPTEYQPSSKLPSDQDLSEKPSPPRIVPIIPQPPETTFGAPVPKNLLSASRDDPQQNTEWPFTFPLPSTAPPDSRPPWVDIGKRVIKNTEKVDFHTRDFTGTIRQVNNLAEAYVTGGEAFEKWNTGNSGTLQRLKDALGNLGPVTEDSKMFARQIAEFYRLHLTGGGELPAPADQQTKLAETLPVLKEPQSQEQPLSSVVPSEINTTPPPVADTQATSNSKDTPSDPAPPVPKHTPNAESTATTLPHVAPPVSSENKTKETRRGGKTQDSKAVRTDTQRPPPKQPHIDCTVWSPAKRGKVFQSCRTEATSYYPKNTKTKVYHLQDAEKEWAWMCVNLGEGGTPLRCDTQRVDWRNKGTVTLTQTVWNPLAKGEESNSNYEEFTDGRNRAWRKDIRKEITYGPDGLKKLTADFQVNSEVPLDDVAANLEALKANGFKGHFAPEFPELDTEELLKGWREGVWDIQIETTEA
ncbi:hypothetical protein TREMEDRAFT_59243 [Tremella mesenterica DSM 1558]|uniref:uncharacterized protein n=1 Tax=Tremella mesenterica (strain ATCC 24925 / CBS 8224 / DSM 1558 / NBRC 9311 / NRRL Y-6157 / RJB 2259-6 / UBC 559-6) TaxID=578456 RepID=UPI0003F4A64D|nr:uncharacterized protein TREMEDRAFT_59243 [Tremella mesenterica DSM 1558]EIW73081.1 hypothetical protein TREMEDRAFT_59243 [Tremella mesenterica DSM 1558]